MRPRLSHGDPKREYNEVPKEKLAKLSQKPHWRYRKRSFAAEANPIGPTPDEDKPTPRLSKPKQTRWEPSPLRTNRYHPRPAIQHIGGCITHATLLTEQQHVTNSVFVRCPAPLFPPLAGGMEGRFRHSIFHTALALRMTARLRHVERRDASVRNADVESQDTEISIDVPPLIIGCGEVRNTGVDHADVEGQQPAPCS